MLYVFAAIGLWVVGMLLCVVPVVILAAALEKYRPKRRGA